MSKSEKVNPVAAPETSAESQTGAISIEHSLLKLNVNDHTEKKNGLTYLSWAWAWAQALKADPAATYAVNTWVVDGKPNLYINVNGTAMVSVSVTLGDRVRTCLLPVMNHRNQPISDPDAFQVNTAIMRCMTKCLALFGLGLYVYAGEDVPEDSEEKKEVKNETVKDPKDSDESLMLFAEGILKHISLQETDAALRSYWKANAVYLDKLKARFPDVHTEVLDAFKQANERLKGKQ